MRISSILAAIVASFFFCGAAQAQYEGLSKFHWKRFIDKNEKQTAAMIAADLAKAGAEHRRQVALAEARLASFQKLATAVETIDVQAHAEVVQLSALTVTVNSDIQGSRPMDEPEQPMRQVVAASTADLDDVTTGSIGRDDSEPDTTGVIYLGPFRLAGRPAAPAVHW